MSSGFEIARTTGRCLIQDRELVPGEAIVVALVERESADAEGFERIDLCDEGWASLPDDPRGAGRKAIPNRRLYAWWRTQQPEPGARPLIAVDDDSLIDLFDELGEDTPSETDPQRASRLAFRYVLTLILSRKRLVKVERSSDTGIFVRPRGTPAEAPSVFVEDPSLTADRLREVMDRLGGLLRGDE
jgi:hypothetical protein